LHTLYSTIRHGNKPERANYEHDKRRPNTQDARTADYTVDASTT